VSHSAKKGKSLYMPSTKKVPMQNGSRRRGRAARDRKRWNEMGEKKGWMERIHGTKVIELAVVMVLVSAFVGLTFIGTANAQTLNATVVSFNSSGIYFANPSEGGNYTTIQVRVCSEGGDSTNLWANFSWDDTNEAYIYLRPNETENKSLGDIPAGECKDVFWVVYINRSTPLPNNQQPPIYRNYTVTVGSDEVADPITVPDTVILKRLQITGQNDITFYYYYPEHITVCTIFSVVCNITIQNTNSPAFFPLDYDPTVVELINASFINSTGTYANISLYFPIGFTESTGNQIIYYFHAIGLGKPAIWPMVMDLRGAPNYKYKQGTGFPDITITLLGDYVWEDLDVDGIQDAGEPGIPNFTVNLYDDTGNTLLQTTTTNETGYYNFTVSSGNYTLQFVAPANYTFTLQNAGTDDTIDSDANETGWTGVISISDQPDYTWDAGLYQYASLGDFVWDDCSVLGYYDGIQQANETGVPTVNVSLYNSTKSLVTTTTTNGMGYYNFTNLTPGVYYLWFERPDVYSGWTLQDQGGDDAKDSDVNATGWTGPITLNSGETNLTLDAGLWAEPCPPIPEMDTLALFSLGLLTLTGYVVLRRRR
jgi:hypothetical protein